MGANSQVINANFPDEIARATQFNCSVTLLNTGDVTWNATGSQPFKLGSQNPQDNTIWGSINRFALPNDVAPQEQVTIPMTLTSPNSNGLFKWSWKILKEGVSWYGETVLQNIYVGDVAESDSTAEFPGGSSGLRSMEIALTPIYKMDGARRKIFWQNNTGNTLNISKTLIWAGVESGSKADVHCQLRRVSDDTFLGMIPFDRYAETNSGSGNCRESDFNPTIELIDGDFIEMFFHATELTGLTNKTVQYRAIFWAS